MPVICKGVPKADDGGGAAKFDATPKELVDNEPNDGAGAGTFPNKVVVVAGAPNAPPVEELGVPPNEKEAAGAGLEAPNVPPVTGAGAVAPKDNPPDGGAPKAPVEVPAEAGELPKVLEGVGVVDANENAPPAGAAVDAPPKLNDDILAGFLLLLLLLSLSLLMLKKADDEEIDDENSLVSVRLLEAPVIAPRLSAGIRVFPPRHTKSNSSGEGARKFWNFTL